MWLSWHRSLPSLQPILYALIILIAFFIWVIFLVYNTPKNRIFPVEKNDIKDSPSLMGIYPRTPWNTIVNCSVFTTTSPFIEVFILVQAFPMTFDPLKLTLCAAYILSTETTSRTCSSCSSCWTTIPRYWTPYTRISKENLAVFKPDSISSSLILEATGNLPRLRLI